MTKISQKHQIFDEPITTNRKLHLSERKVEDHLQTFEQKIHEAKFLSPKNRSSLMNGIYIDSLNINLNLQIKISLPPSPVSPLDQRV